MNDVTNKNGDAGYSVGNRTERPHHPDGWHPQRESDAGSDEPNPRRGQPPASGEHDRPKKN